MELRDYLRIALRHWVLILSMAIIGMGVGASVSLLMTPRYQSQTQLYVSVGPGTGDTGDLVMGASFAQQIVTSYVDVIETSGVLNPVAEELQLEMTGNDLAKYVEASSPLDSVLINITATSPAPEQAAQIANAVGESFKEFVGTQLEFREGSAANLVNLTTTQTAFVPAAPETPNLINNLVLGLFGGLALGYGIAMLRGVFDNRVRSASDVQEVTDKPLLGEIFDDSDSSKSRLISENEWQSPRAEAYRALRTNLQFLDVNSSNRVFVVTSPSPGEGKTTTAMNLAFTISQNGARVVLIEGDLRRPKIGKYLGIETGTGLTDVLIGRAKLEDVLQRWGRTDLHILPAGRIPPNPSELLGSDEMKENLKTLQSQFDYVIIDVPPILAVTDSVVVGKFAAGILLIAASGRTTSQDLEKSLLAIETAGTDVLGMIVTMVPSKGADRYSYSSDQQGFFTTTASETSSRRKSTTSSRRKSSLTTTAVPVKVDRMKSVKDNDGTPEITTTAVPAMAEDV
ncbi:polysaccharide biosynthesis tyrosine autokinase [Corynebacterium sp. A21]|uniref:polysaccharide biosynthesis tyrosine autokinase n=1 Tax=Corynebacterium sp. A21 TaxID=3457318 RepID=UPI003FD3CF0D